MKLTAKQAAFIHEYLIDLNGTQSAIRAGYSKKTANEQSTRLLANVHIRAAVDKALKKRANKSEISAQWVLDSLKAVAERCMTAVPVMVRDGDEWVESGEWKFDSSGANKSLELIGKHLGMFMGTEKPAEPNLYDAFIPQVETEARKRLEELTH